MDGTRLKVKAGYHNTQMDEALGGAYYGCTQIRSSAARRLEPYAPASPANHPTLPAIDPDSGKAKGTGADIPDDK